jgi:TrmH family RNA methyltransferase
VLVADALAAGVELRALYAEPAADAGLIALVARTGAPVHRVHEGVLSKVLDLVSPQPVVGVGAQPRHRLDAVLRAGADRRRSVLVLVGIQDPGNAGTLVRVAEGAGCAGVVLCAGSVDLFNPKTVRATAGSLFRVPVVQSVEWGEVLVGADASGLSSVATVAGGGSPPEEVALGGAVAVFLGSEAHGLPAELVERAGRRVTVPMDGEIESLNAAVAGAVLAFEGARQRRGIADGG